MGKEGCTACFCDKSNRPGGVKAIKFYSGRIKLKGTIPLEMKRIAYLSQDHLFQLLARGRAVEEWLGLGQKDGEQTLQWVCVQREPPPVLTYSVVLKEVYAERESLLTDLPLLDVDEPEGKISSFETREEALDYVVQELGGNLDRFVRDGEIQQEYEKYLSEHSAAPGTSVQNDRVEQSHVSIEAETPQVILDYRYVPAPRSWQDWMREWRRPLRTQVIFEYPARFVGTEADNAGVLSVKGVRWFVFFLKSIPDLEVNSKLCQEDWGVVIFAKRHGRDFDVGLNWMDEGKWLAHIHYGGIFGWVRRYSPSHKRELLCLVMDLHSVLSLYQSVKGIAWYSDKEAFKGFTGEGCPTPG